MSTDWELFSHLRAPLPKWWMSPSARSADVWGGDGVTFQITRGEETWRCLVAYSIMEQLLGSKLSRVEAERIWLSHSDDFKTAAMRTIKAKKLRTTRTIRITLADVIDIEIV